jgi:hypothetical protein
MSFRGFIMDSFDIHGFIILPFCKVDECTGEQEQHDNAKLHPSEIVTLALLKRMSGKAYLRFLLWLKMTGLIPPVTGLHSSVPLVSPVS